MIHLGDITKINGYTAPIVDCIIGGSPCQDLSIAGKRAGLDGERSGLYMEQLRIVKEMRERDVRDNGRTGEFIRPRYMVWENVPGSFSSNKAEDFRIVLEEIAKIKDKDAVIPQPPNGKWTTSGCVMGDGWSIAWRVLDAQFRGVPQRRRRISLIADFGGQSAPEILFIRKSVSGDSDESITKREKAACDATGSTGVHDINGVPYTLKIRSGCEGGGKGALIQKDLSATLSTLQDQTLFQPVGCDVYNFALTDDKTCSLTSQGHTSTGTCPKVIQPVVALDRSSYNQGKNAQFDIGIDENGIAHSLVAKGPGAVCYGIGNGQVDGTGLHEKIESLNCMHDQQAVMIAAVDCRNETEDECNGALQSNSAHSLNGNNVVIVRYIVRRLTPLECERLQGYPDNWTLLGEPTEKVVEDFDEDTGEKTGEHIETEFYYTNSQGKRVKCSDAARYKALGNSIALPPWKWVLKRLCACYERDATMASLFDGIGGFPYLWEQLNGKGSCLWASEIEEFPIAVTKVRIGE